MSRPNSKQATVSDLLTALQRVETWIHDIRCALKQIDTDQSILLSPQPLSSPLSAAGQCPPPLPEYPPPGPENPPSAPEYPPSAPEHRSRSRSKRTRK